MATEIADSEFMPKRRLPPDAFVDPDVQEQRLESENNLILTFLVFVALAVVAFFGWLLAVS